MTNTETVSCNLCGAENTWTIAAHLPATKESKVVMCRQCGLIYLSPRRKDVEEFYAEEYRKAYDHATSPTPELIREYDDRAGRRFNFLEKNSAAPQPGSRVLEIGCNAGNFLKLLKEHGSVCEGIEPNAVYARYGQNHYGLMIHPTIFEKAALQSPRYNHISIIHALEHIRDPKSVLTKIYSLLGEGGTLFLEIPDIRAALRRPRFNKHAYFHEAHFYDFSEKTITQMLMRCGFQILHKDHDTKPPGDKNIRIIATKDNQRNASPPFNPQHARQIYWHIWWHDLWEHLHSLKHSVKNIW